jgi:Acetyltransferase (GNAT) domain
LDEETISRWGLLEERALESNAYLSPRFVIPAARHLAGPKEAPEILFVFVEKVNGGVDRLSGAGVFLPSAGTPSLPFPHLKAFLSPHSFLSGLLIDRDEAEEVARAFFQFFCRKEEPWHGVAFTCRASEGSQARLLAAVAEDYGATWHESESTRRAIFVPGKGGDKYLQGHLSPHRAKMIRQMRRRLEERGEVRWKTLFGSEIGQDNVSRFLELEHMGWKGEQGTSLRARPSHEAFFREMVEAFRIDGRLFFTELSLDDRVIASTANMVSGGAGFAFKIAWHADYSKLSPGVLNEVEFIRRAPALCRGLSYVDSGAEEGSFIDHLWSERRGISSGVFATSSFGRRILRGVEYMRRIKRYCMSLKHRGVGHSPPP